MRSRHFLAALLVLAVPAVAAADILVVGGKPVRCTWWEEGGEVVVNPYNSSNHAMTWGVERKPRAQVNLEKVRSTETPEEEYCRKAFDARNGTAADHAALAKGCEEKKLKDLAAREWERVLEIEPANEEAKKALGGNALKEINRRNGKVNAALGDLLRQYMASDNAATRRVLIERMKREQDLSLPGYYLERAYRSSKKPGGRTDDVPLAVRSDRVKGEAGAVYTMFVPPNYDPLRPTPLLLGLHGGGGGGKAGDKVVGNGPSAMNFYTGIAEEHGWLVACPTSLVPHWGGKEDDALLEAVLEEVELLYNVDLNRVYLTGHSMGGYGTWHYGPLWAERWAAICPMAGAGGPGLPRLQDTQTFCFVFHGADDPVVGVAPDRAAAKSLMDAGADFVYTELNGVGHGCPQEVLTEMATLFEKKRLALGHGKAFRRSDEIRSSFLQKPKPGSDEAHYLGDPEPPDPNAKAETAEAKRKRLLADIDIGGGKAKAAAAAFAEFKDAESVKPLGARAVNPKAPDDVREAAAMALGSIGSPDGLAFLETALNDENDRVFLAATAAVVAVGDRKAGPSLLTAIDLQVKRFLGKLQGSVMDYPDFDPRCAALGAIANAAATLADPKEAVDHIRDRILKAVFETKYTVTELERAGMVPSVVRERFAKELVEALVKTGHPSAKEALARLKADCPRQKPIGDACDDGIRRLAEGPPATPPADPAGH